MPSWIKTDRDEHLWEKAKSQVTKEYGLTDADGDRYYRLVTGIWQRMKGIHKSEATAPMIPKRTAQAFLQQAAHGLTRMAFKAAQTKRVIARQPGLALTGPAGRRRWKRVVAMTPESGQIAAQETFGQYGYSLPIARGRVIEHLILHENPQKAGWQWKELLKFLPEGERPEDFGILDSSPMRSKVFAVLPEDQGAEWYIFQRPDTLIPSQRKQMVKQQAEQAGEQQMSLFKARVKAHTAKNPSGRGTHIVHEHERHGGAPLAHLPALERLSYTQEIQGRKYHTGLINPEAWASRHMKENGIRRIESDRPILTGPGQGKFTPAGYVTFNSHAGDSTYWGKTIREAFDNAREGRGVSLENALRDEHGKKDYDFDWEKKDWVRKAVPAKGSHYEPGARVGSASGSTRHRAPGKRMKQGFGWDPLDTAPIRIAFEQAGVKPYWVDRAREAVHSLCVSNFGRSTYTILGVDREFPASGGFRFRRMADGAAFDLRLEGRTPQSRVWKTTRIDKADAKKSVPAKGSHYEPGGTKPGATRHREPGKRTQQQLFQADRRKYPDGRMMPAEGDEVYMTVPGMFGVGAVINGEVYHSGGGPRVRVTGTRSILGGGTTAKTYPLDSRWTVVGDPEMARRTEAKRKAEQEAEEAKDRAREEQEQLANKWKHQKLAIGWKCLSDATPPMGSSIWAWSAIAEAPMRLIVLKHADDGTIEASRPGEEHYAGSSIGKKEADWLYDPDTPLVDVRAAARGNVDKLLQEGALTLKDVESEYPELAEKHRARQQATDAEAGLPDTGGPTIPEWLGQAKTKKVGTLTANGTDYPVMLGHKLNKRTNENVPDWYIDHGKGKREWFDLWAADDATLGEMHRTFIEEVLGNGRNEGLSFKPAWESGTQTVSRR